MLLTDLCLSRGDICQKVFAYTEEPLSPPSLSLHESDGGTAAQVTHLEFTEKPWQGSRLLAPCASLCCLAET